MMRSSRVFEREWGRRRRGGWRVVRALRLPRTCVGESAGVWSRRRRVWWVGRVVRVAVWV